jgi:hypothetical protein
MRDEIEFHAKKVSIVGADKSLLSIVRVACFAG